jgi:hypothetical protein
LFPTPQSNFQRPLRPPTPRKFQLLSPPLRSEQVETKKSPPDTATVEPITNLKWKKRETPLTLHRSTPPQRDEQKIRKVRLALHRSSPSQRDKRVLTRQICVRRSRAHIVKS